MISTLLDTITGMLSKLFQRDRPPIAVDVLTGYAHWAKTYPPSAHNPLLKLEQQAMLSLWPADLKGKHCLDLACGSGRYLQLLQVRQAASVTGLDLSPHMLQQLKKNELQPTEKADRQPGLVVSTFLEMPLPTATFHLITCGMAVGHTARLNQFLAEAARVLQPGGSLIYSDFHPFGALSGWQRSFSNEAGQVFQVEHYTHLYSQHVEACHLAGLTITAAREPLLGEHALSAQFQQFPAVLVIRAYKPENIRV